MVDQDLRIQVEEVFQHVFTIVRQFTEQTKLLQFNPDQIEIDYDLLVRLDPSADSVADTVRFLKNLLEAIVEITEDPLHENMLINVTHCTLGLESLARAINKKDEEEFKHAIKQLHLATNHGK